MSKKRIIDERIREFPNYFNKDEIETIRERIVIDENGKRKEELTITNKKLKKGHIVSRESFMDYIDRAFALKLRDHIPENVIQEFNYLLQGLEFDLSEKVIELEMMYGDRDGEKEE